MMFSLLLHLLVLFSFHFYLQLQPLQLKKPAHVFNARLVAGPPSAPRVLPAKKLLTIPTPSTIKVAQQAAQPPAASAQNTISSQDEQIDGIAMPSTIALPFAGYVNEGNVFLKERDARKNAMLAYQEHVKTMQVNKQAEIQAQFLLKQLNDILEKLAAEEPVLEGKCVINESAQYFECDSVPLKQKVLKIEPVAIGIFNGLKKTGKNHNGFIFSRQNNLLTPLLITEHPPQRSK